MTSFLVVFATVLVAFIALESKAVTLVQLKCTRNTNIFIRIYVSSRRFQFSMKRHHTLAQQFKSRECKDTPRKQINFSADYVLRNSRTRFIRRRSWLVYAPRGALFTAPIGPYPTRTWFPYDSYLTMGKECVARFSRRSWWTNAWRTLGESAREASVTSLSHPWSLE